LFYEFHFNLRGWGGRGVSSIGRAMLLHSIGSQFDPDTLQFKSSQVKSSRVERGGRGVSSIGRAMLLHSIGSQFDPDTLQFNPSKVEW
jgi:hypothetical protein